jgi:hypothetical protein
MAEVEFRNGIQEIPDYLADLMTGMDTYTMTVDEAIAEVNKKLERDQLSKVHNELVKNHFSPFGHGRGAS